MQINHCLNRERSVDIPTLTINIGYMALRRLLETIAGRGFSEIIADVICIEVKRFDDAL